MPKGFVREDPESNATYLAEWKDDIWWPAIEKCHERLLYLDPNYQITQIKEKFNGLRYYFRASFLADSDRIRFEIMQTVMLAAEQEAANLSRRVGR